MGKKNKKNKRGLPPPPQAVRATVDEQESSAGEDEVGKRAKPTGGAASGGRDQQKDSKENLVFEDPYEDEYEEEEVFDDDDEGAAGTGGGDGMDVDDGVGKRQTKQVKFADAQGAGGGGVADVDMMVEDEDENEQNAATKRTWLGPGAAQTMEDGQQLEYDPSAYVMYHALTPEWPCLSFDVIRDQLGGGRARFPVTMYAVCGTQADRASANKLTLMKLSEMHKTQKKGEDDSDDESDSDDEDAVEADPILEQQSVDHRGGVNRVRSMPQRAGIVSSWADTGHVHVWDLHPLIRALDHAGSGAAGVGMKPLMSHGGHRGEGFALDWSPVQEGRMVSGDNDGMIHLWQPAEGGKWSVDTKAAFKGHSSSVEDLQWSPSEASVFISASSDQTLRVWDIRNRTGSMLTTKAHDADVNVCSWNRNVAYLLVSGADDGSFKVWDLRNFTKGQPIANFAWHKGPITSIEWHPVDESILACSGDDDQVTIWDLSVEEDDDAGAAREEGLEALPPQLLFVHQGQKEIKELHFHPQIPGLVMTTAMDGFNVFRPAI